MSHSPEEVRKHVKIYLGVFFALMALTIVTVAISYFHLPMAQAVLIALIVASIKAALVAMFFMHLVTEKKIVLSILILTVVFFLALVFLTLWTDVSVPKGYVP